MSTLTIKERIQAVQRRLGVVADGLLGPVSLTRLEAVLTSCLGPLDEEPANLVVSQRGLSLIVREEISSEAFYRRSLTHPVWPGGESGLTVGIGYDLGHTPAGQIEKDWRGRITDADLASLLTIVGRKGEAANQARDGVSHVTVPFEAAKVVFYTSTLPRFARLTRRAYPGIEELPADAQAALLSLVYNRGASKSGARRREMKALEALVRNGDLGGIAEQIRAMKRLWENRGLPGLLKRRDREADLVAGADRRYEQAELIKL